MLGSACASEERFHILAWDERLRLGLAFSEEFPGDEIADLALADSEIGGSFLGCVGRLPRDKSLLGIRSHAAVTVVATFADSDCGCRFGEWLSGNTSASGMCPLIGGNKCSSRTPKTRTK